MPHAVDRNRTRRQMREAARLCTPGTGLDIIATAKAPALRATFAEICQSLAAELARSERRLESK